MYKYQQLMAMMQPQWILSHDDDDEEFEETTDDDEYFEPTNITRIIPRPQPSKEAPKPALMSSSTLSSQESSTEPSPATSTETPEAHSVHKSEVIDEDGVRTYKYQRPRVTKSGEVKYTEVRRKYVPKANPNERRDISAEIIKEMKLANPETKGVAARYQEYAEKMQAKGQTPYAKRSFVHEFRCAAVERPSSPQAQT